MQRFASGRHDMKFDISLADRKALLALARDSIATAFDGRQPEMPSLQDNIRCGAFVTLRIDGDLRGCIGRMHSNDLLPVTIAEMARAAAFEDPRFPPLSPDELDRIEIEITLLSPLRPVRPEEVQPGVHGILISAYGRSGVLLPQVAIEYGWDRETFLSQVCRKAGLPPDTWRSDAAQLYAFEGLIFSESVSDGA